MENGTPGIDAPEIVLRIPGRWKAPVALADALPDGFVLNRDHLTLPDGSSVEFLPLPPDGEFPSVFVSACGRHRTVRGRRAVNRYAVNACLVAPGGSVEAAQRAMHAATGLLDAGGIGVFVDNGLVAHEARRWREIIEPLDAAAIFLGLVNVLRGESELWTVGMHAMGRRDVRLPRTGDDDRDEGTLFAFVEHVCSPGGRMTDGDFFVWNDRRVRVSCRECTRFRTEAPPFNPYGTWKLAWTR